MKIVKNTVVELHSAETDLKQKNRYLQKLASALATGLANPFGSELVAIIGDGHERNNREALLTWVLYRRREVFTQRLEGSCPLEYLAAELQYKLDAQF